MSELQKYRKKPVEIEAAQWDGNVRVDHPVTVWIRDHGGTYGYTSTQPQRLVIQTLEGGTIANPGDWIIRGVAGEFYPCKADIFAATYEAVTA